MTNKSVLYFKIQSTNSIVWQDNTYTKKKQTQR